MAERWSDPAFERSTPRPSQRLDRLVNAGRQLVDGVSGARPGSRKVGRVVGPGPGMGPRLGELGRWVEDKLDWILEDDEDWREPWQEPRESARPGPGSAPAQGAGGVAASRSSSRRRPLEAISRRGLGGRPAAAAEDAWPDDDSFSRPRWQRSAGDSSQAGEVIQPAPQSVRAVPRSSRRRQSD